MPIFSNLSKTVGRTPLVKLNRIGAELPATILAKLEFMNPLGSVKDRIGVSMIETAEAQRLINKDTVIIEPTSGNTGIALASMCAMRKYRLIITMSEGMSESRKRLLAHLGAEVILTPADLGTRGAVEKARELASRYSDVFMPDQFSNPANPAIHRRTTAEEIWQDTQGQADILVAGVGTGGTITGISEVLKKRKKLFKAVAVEPAESPVLSGGRPGLHCIPGIGAGFIPKILNRKVLDEVVAVTSKQALETAREMARQEGISCGISSGAAVWCALEIAKNPENKGKQIVVILPGSAERDLNT